jgi:hypothetical protein
LAALFLISAIFLVIAFESASRTRAFVPKMVSRFGAGGALQTVFNALSAYLTVILDDTAQNVPGRLDLRDAEAVLADLASDVTGIIQRAADCMAGSVL